MAEKENNAEGWSWSECFTESKGVSESVSETNEKGETITHSKGWSEGRSVMKPKGDEKKPE